MLIETGRLYLREKDQSDFESLCRIMQDTETMYAFETLNAKEVCSIIRDTNIASQNVAAQ